MPEIADLLTQLDKRLKENNIRKKDIDKYMYIYLFDEEDLERLLSLEWDNPIVLSSLIKAISSTSKNKEKKIALLEEIIDKTDIRYDREKVLAATKVVNGIDMFREDTDMASLITGMILNSKTDEGARAAASVTRDVLEYYEEKLHDKEHKEGDITIRLASIVGFITRAEDVYKVNAFYDITRRYSKDKLGVMCGLVSIANMATNKEDANMVVDIDSNKDIISSKYELEAANEVVKSGRQRVR